MKALMFAILVALSGCATMPDNQPDIDNLHNRVTALEEEVDWQQKTLDGLLDTLGAILGRGNAK